MKVQLKTVSPFSSSVSKVMAMFTGELGFETAFTAATNLCKDPLYNIWIIILYGGFIFEMCIILMNLVSCLCCSLDNRINLLHNV